MDVKSGMRKRVIVWPSLSLNLYFLLVALSLVAGQLPNYIIAFHQLTTLLKKVSHEVVKGGGIVRAVHNHGIRDLPQRFRAKQSDPLWGRYFTLGRFFSVYYDANPFTAKQVEQIFKRDERILRSTHLRTRSALDLVNLPEDRNPYIKRVLREEKLRNQANHQDHSDSTEASDMRTDGGA